MTGTTEMRELFVLDGPDGVVRGTYHKTCSDNSGASWSSTEVERIGLLFLTGLFQTRAANGDSAVYWADAFATRGYPSFRLDLPGFGDSDGNPPAEMLPFINQGKYAPIVSSTISELIARFDLAGVIIVGHCTGTVSGIYAAAANKECRGLVLMDPIFYLPQGKLTVLKFRRLLHEWVLRCHLDGLLTKIYDFSKEIWLFVRGNAPPANANFPLLRRWKDLTSAGLPVLILKSPGRKSPGTKTRIGEFDYVQHVVELSGRKSRVVVEVTEGANHSFANILGRAAVRQHTEQWLSANFPLTEHTDAYEHALHPDSSVAK